MMYRIKLTPNAVEQIGSVVGYISNELHSPETALRWSDLLKSEIAKLSEMPARFRLFDTDPWRSLGIHVLPVKNFIVYFWINEEEQAVWITAVVYQRRDQLKALLEMPLDMI